MKFISQVCWRARKNIFRTDVPSFKINGWRGLRRSQPKSKSPPVTQKVQNIIGVAILDDGHDPSLLLIE